MKECMHGLQRQMRIKVILNHYPGISDKDAVAKVNDWEETAKDQDRKFPVSLAQSTACNPNLETK